MSVWLSLLGRVNACLCAGLLVLALALAAPPAARAAPSAPEPRLALVIANGAYGALPALRNAHADGEAVANALSGARFLDASGAGPVRARRDLTNAQLEAEIEAFKARLAEAGPTAFGVVYFSGHGVALGSYGDTALLAVDQSLAPGQSLMTRARIADALLGGGARTAVVVLDMCRNAVAANVAGGKGLPELAPEGSKGLVRYAASQRRPDQGYLIAYSTSPDQVAFDTGQFSKVLAEEIRRPGQNVAEVFKRVSDRVALGSAGGKWQKPTFDYGLQGDAPCFVNCNPNTDASRFYDCANCPWMKAVPAADAQIGSPSGEPGRRSDEPLAHPVRIPRPFALGVFELTLAEWAACEREGGCRKRPNWSKDNPNPLIPASHLTYEDARDYLAWISSRSGRAYRLPTEAEWEYAARAGGSGAFGFGDEISPDLANYDHTARYEGSPTAPYRGYPEAVTGYPANPLGLTQMLGNVWEWVACPAPCERPVVRGGSFQSAPTELRAANRFALAPDKARPDVGLRVARDLEADEAGR